MLSKYIVSLMFLKYSCQRANFIIDFMVEFKVIIAIANIASEEDVASSFDNRGASSVSVDDVARRDRIQDLG